MKPASRVEFMDIARSLGMATVIVGHVLILFATKPSPFDAEAFFGTRLIYAFHMPLFFFLSGVMYRARGIKHAVTSGLVLVMLAQLTHFVGLGLAVIVTGRDVGIGVLLEPVILLRSFSLGVTWFLAAIAITRVLYACLYEGGVYVRAGAMVLVVASLGVTLASNTTAFQVHTWWAGVLFYAVGHYCAVVLMKRLDPRAATAWSRARIGAAFVVAAVVTVVLSTLNLGCTVDPFARCGSAVLHDQFMVRMTGAQYGFIPLFVVTALCGTACVIFASALMAGLPARARALLVWGGQNTLTLLILNGCFLVTANGFIRAGMAEVSWSGWPWALSVGVLVLHIAVLPLAIPLVTALERALGRLINAVFP